MQLGVPLIREAVERKPAMSKAEAQQLLVHTMEVLFYRDARSFPKVGFISMSHFFICILPIGLSPSNAVLNFISSIKLALLLLME